MNIFYHLSNYVGIHHKAKDYIALAKKEDSFGLEEARQWISNHPISDAKDVKDTSLEKITAYTKDLMKSLKCIPITSKNAPLIQAHLIKIYTGNSLLWQKIVPGTLSLKGEPKVIKELHDHLACKLYW